MKIDLLAFRLTVLLFVFIVAACSTAVGEPVPADPLPAPAATASPTAAPPTSEMAAVPSFCHALAELESPKGIAADDVVMQVVEKINAGDVIGAMAHFSNDAVLHQIGVPPTPHRSFSGRTEICAFWDEQVRDDLRWEMEVESTNQLEARSLVGGAAGRWLDSTRKLGVAPTEFTERFIIEEGQITILVSILTEASLTNYREALGELVSDEVEAEGAFEIAGSEVTFTASGGTCLYEGPHGWQGRYMNITLASNESDGDI